MEQPPRPEPKVDQPSAIPRTRPDPDGPLEGEVIPKGAPIGRLVDAQPRDLGTATPKPGKLRRVLIVVAAAVTAVCLGGLGVAYFTYDQATQPDRSTPAVTVRQFVDATFSERSEIQTQRFICATPDFGELQGMLTNLRTIEDRYSIRISVSVTNLRENTSGRDGTVEADLRIDTPEADGRLSRSTQGWEFKLVDESGWRVCGAHRVS